MLLLPPEIYLKQKNKAIYCIYLKYLAYIQYYSEFIKKI